MLHERLVVEDKQKGEFMTAKEAAKKAVDETRRLMSGVNRKESELAIFEAFDEAFDAEIEGWRMRIEELKVDEE